jgi:hypothetical protein
MTNTNKYNTKPEDYIFFCGGVFSPTGYWLGTREELEVHSNLLANPQTQRMPGFGDYDLSRFYVYWDKIWDVYGNNWTRAEWREEMVNGKITGIKVGDKVYDLTGQVLGIALNNQGSFHKGKNMEKFWMCLVEGSSTSSFRHTSEHSARTEAERLSRSLDKKVFVLEATDYVEVQKPVVWKKTQEVPF